MKKLVFATSATLLCAFCTPNAFGDGLLPAPYSSSGNPTGAYGANRRVLTLPTGYTAVSGSFSVPEIQLPQGIWLDEGEDPYRTKPTFYLGCSQETIRGDDDAIYPRLEVDAGVQYEAEAFQVGAEYIDPGWSVFIRTTGGATGGFGNPNGVQTNPAGGWRCGPGTANPGVTSFDLLWSMNPRSIFAGGGYGGYLQVNAAGANGQPQDKDLGGSRIRARIAYAGDQNDFRLSFALDEMRVKRAVGITQGGDILFFPLDDSRPGLYHEDGSYMINSVFSNGKVSQQNPAPSGANHTYTPTQWNTWDAMATDNPATKDSGDTGYYPGGRDRTIYRGLLGAPVLGPAREELEHGPGHLPIFSFPSIPIVSDWEENNSSRYANETVDIRLRSFRPVGGSSIIIGPGGVTE